MKTKPTFTTTIVRLRENERAVSNCEVCDRVGQWEWFDSMTRERLCSECMKSALSAEQALAKAGMCPMPANHKRNV